MYRLDALLNIKEEEIPHNNANRICLDWKKAQNAKPSFGGVYVFWWKGSAQNFLSSVQNPKIHFVGPGEKILTLKIEESVISDSKNGMLPLYVGKASNIAKRIGQHLKLGTKRTVPSKAVSSTSKRMTTSCQVRDRLDRLFPDIDDTRHLALKKLALSYVEIDGVNNFLDRFFLEDLAIGVLRPIFNVDSER